MNSVNIAGRLVAEPEAIGRNENNPGARFRVAVRDLRFGDTYFISCVAWSQTARFILDYLHKGDFVLGNGRITSREATTKDGRNTAFIDVVIDTLRSGPRTGGTQSFEDEPHYRQNNYQARSFASTPKKRDYQPRFNGQEPTTSITNELANLDEAFPDTVDLNLDEAFSMQTFDPDQPQSAPATTKQTATVDVPWSDEFDDE